MTIYSTGEMSGRIAEKELRRLQIPVPEEHHRLGAMFREHRCNDNLSHLLPQRRWFPAAGVHSQSTLSC